MRATKKEIRIPQPRQLPSGSWNIQLRLEGKSISVTEDTEALCRAKATAIKAGIVNKPEAAPPKKKAVPTLGQLIDSYIEDRENVLSPSTVRGYDIMRRNRFKTYMDTPADKINYQRMVSDELSHCSPKTLYNAWGIVSSSLRYAGLPVPAVKLAEVVVEEPEFLTATQIKAFIERLRTQPPQHELAGLLCLHGLRISEVKDLTKADITATEIRVSGAAVPDKRNVLIHKKANKNKPSNRYVPIFLPRINELMEQMPDTGYLVTISEKNLLEQVKKVCAEIGAPDVGLHGLRHSFASFALITMGIPLDAVRRLGGWATTDTLQKIYAHYADEERKKHTAQMAGFFKNANETLTNEKNAGNTGL